MITLFGSPLTASAIEYNSPIYIANPTPEGNDSFGWSVSISGNKILVGAYNDSTGAYYTGSAYLFNATTSTLLHTFNNPTPESGDWFGSSVSISGNKILVGTPNDDTGVTNAGAAYTFLN